jgi:DNA-binding transcriptional regulator WhiA
MNKATTKSKQKMQTNNVRISREIRDIIHGYIMSDGYISKTNNLQVDQGLDQEKFVNWLYGKLKPLCTDNGPVKVERVDKRTNTKTYSIRFNTRNLLCGFNSMWYKQETDANGKPVRRKSLPQSIACFFSSTFVTLWFAGDGTKNTDYRGAKFEVTAFTPKERLLLKKLFKKKFDITTNINKAGTSTKDTQQWVLQIPADQYNKFRDIITEMDLIQNLFPYKLHEKQQ